MRSTYRYILLVVIVIFGFANLALAEEKPLMVIRFAGNPAGYEERLAAAVKMALQKKPDVNFEVVAVTQETTDKKTSKTSDENAKLLIAKITQLIKESGVSAESIHANQSTSPVVKGQEIQIFVQ